MAYRDLRDYLNALERRGKLHHVKKEVDPDWEVTAVMRRVFQRIPPARRPATLFERIKGFSMTLVAGILGASPEVYALALQTTVDNYLLGVPASAGLCRYHTLERGHPTFPTHPSTSPG